MTSPLPKPSFSRCLYACILPPASQIQSWVIAQTQATQARLIETPSVVDPDDVHSPTYFISHACEVCSAAACLPCEPQARGVKGKAGRGLWALRCAAASASPWHGTHHTAHLQEPQLVVQERQLVVQLRRHCAEEPPLGVLVLLLL